MVLPILGTRQLESRARDLGIQVYSAVQGNGSTGSNKRALSAGIRYLADLLEKADGITEYSRNPLGDEKVIEETAKILANFYHISEEELKQRLGFFVGAQQGEVAVALAIGAKLQAKDKLDIYVQVPGYPNYHRTLAHGFTEYDYRGSKVESLHINDERGYATADEIEGSIKSSYEQGRKPIILLTIPSNPQGKSPPREEMRKIAHMLDKYPEVYTIVDQAFLEMDFSRRFETFAEVIAEEGLADLQKRFSYSRTNTKAGGLPTERGNVVVLPEDREIIKAVSDYINITIFNSSVVAQHLLVGFLRDFHLNQEACLSTYLPAYERNFQSINEALNRAGVAHSTPEAGFFTVIDFSSLKGMKVPLEMIRTLRGRASESEEILLEDIDIPDGIIKTDKDVFNLMLFVGNAQEKKAVSALPGQFCGYAPEDCKVRFCFGMSHERLKEAGKVIEHIVEQVREQNRETERKPKGPLDWADRDKDKVITRQ